MYVRVYYIDCIDQVKYTNGFQIEIMFILKKYHLNGINNMANGYRN